MKAFEPIRLAVTLPVSEEMLAEREGFSRRGHLEPVTPDPEQIALHRRAEELVAEIESNPYVDISGYDWELNVAPLPTDRWVWDESHEEYMERWRAARS
ncbi:hypothetical protein NS183_07670 [Microbacterium testaceum]|uniref:hypothetical protein n=1 Tax=Microbacterium testaceum TaxID=2033 RepID=UPI000734FE06|nr:hypothetical protein [Microbacterium testaceum]KTS90658.1 hypothetical protein NS183_07670 [Microbacterium testaceum]